MFRFCCKTNIWLKLIFPHHELNYTENQLERLIFKLSNSFLNSNLNFSFLVLNLKLLIEDISKLYFFCGIKVLFFLLSSFIDICFRNDTFPYICYNYEVF